MKAQRAIRVPSAVVVCCLLLGASGCGPETLTDNGVVGSFGGVGLGLGAFSYPRAITVDQQGSVYVVDKSARIQRFDADGHAELFWTMPEKQSGKPIGLAVHPDGRVFVADTHYHRVLVFDRDGNELARFGGEGFGDGEFQLPTDVAFDADGFIYVSEYSGNDRITKWSPDLQFVAALADQPIDGKRLLRPSAIDIDDEQTLWIADACNHRIVRLDLDGRVLTTFGVMGREPGQLRYPYDIACTPDGKILVCEYGNHRLQWFDHQGQSLGVWGGEGRELGRLWSPWGATVGPNGLVYVVDSYNSRIQIVRP